MSVRSEFGNQQILDIATGAIDSRDHIVGRGQRSQSLIDAGPDLRLILQNQMDDGVNCRQFVLQPVLELLHDELAIQLFLHQAF